MEYIVVQAGGKGTRLEHLTTNKPKALVPVENLPMIFHLFRRFPDKRFIVIADYHRDVLREYLAAFADVTYQVVEAAGSGTCGGVDQALALLPDRRAVHARVVGPDPARHVRAPQRRTATGSGISQTFECRWSYADGGFAEERSREHGVAGLFVFEDKSALAGIPASGELVRWLQQQGPRLRASWALRAPASSACCVSTRRSPPRRRGPFNRATVVGDTFIKEPVDAQGRSLARRESGWYRHALQVGVRNIPRLYGFEPLTMERIDGRNIYEYAELPLDDKREVLADLTAALRGLHGLESAPADSFSVREAYYGKTVERLKAVRDLIPFADRETIVVNGRQCRNPYFHRRDLERALDALTVEQFAFIHGDPTFSNLMLRGGTEPLFIDPRGYFGHTELMATRTTTGPSSTTRSSETTTSSTSRTSVSASMPTPSS